MTSKTELTCQICGSTIDLEHVVYCRKCGTPHHKDCWEYNLQCSTFGCGSRFHTDDPPHKEPGQKSDSSNESSSDILVITDSTALPKVPDDVLIIADETKSSRNQRNNYSPVTLLPPPEFFNRDLEDYFFRETDFTADYVRIDTNTLLETFLLYGSLFFMVIILFVCFPNYGPPRWTLIKILCSVSLLLATTRLFTDCTYIIDNKRERLLYARSIFGHTTTYHVDSFDRLQSTGIRTTEKNSKYSTYYLYTPVLKLSNDISIPTLKKTTQYYRAFNHTNKLAHALNIPFIEPQLEQSSFMVRFGEVNLVESDLKWGKWYQKIHPGFLEMFLFLISAGLTYFSMGN